MGQAVIDTIAAEFNRRSPTQEVLTPGFHLCSEKVNNTNLVKTQLAADGRASTFSRSAIPLVLDIDPVR
jgi:3-deoxy-manno-octulosonate cytidylyltransferase (CMP-KDO synthetase)